MTNYLAVLSSFPPAQSFQKIASDKFDLTQISPWRNQFNPGAVLGFNEVRCKIFYINFIRSRARSSRSHLRSTRTTTTSTVIEFGCGSEFGKGVALSAYAGYVILCGLLKVR